MALVLPAHLSYSAVSTYSECGERYRLERGYGKNNTTWYATVAGTAIHLLTERYDLLDFGVGDTSTPLPSFQEVFSDLLRAEAERGTVVKASGKVCKTITASGGPNKKDRDWWMEYGPLYLQGYFEWREEHPNWKIAVMPDGQPGIEVGVEAVLGGVPVKGFIDRVFLVDEETVVVVDLKTGSVPHGKLQLATYRTAMLKTFGLAPDWGGFWMAKDRDFAGGLCDLTRFDPEWVELQYSMARRGIEAGVFLPHVTSMCKGCGVRDYCRAMGGLAVDEVPLTDVVQITKPGVDKPGNV